MGSDPQPYLYERTAGPICLTPSINGGLRRNTSHGHSAWSYMWKCQPHTKRVFVCAVLKVTVVTQEVPNVDPGHYAIVRKNLPFFEENSSPLHSRLKHARTYTYCV